MVKRRLRKCPVGKMSFGNLLVGKMPTGKISGWESIWMGKCLVEKLSFFFAKMSLGYCRLGKTRVEKLSFGILSEYPFEFVGLMPRSL